MRPAGHALDVRLLRREDAPPLPGRNYLSLHRLSLENAYGDGTSSREYAYDAVLRRYLDAVALVLTAGEGREIRVCLRACIRPSLLLRTGAALPVEEAARKPILWELPAGLVESGDVGKDGIRSRAAAEALEETGLVVPPGEFEFLGGAPFVSPGVIPERMHFVRAAIRDPGAARVPQGDGSPVEERAEIAWLELEEALAACDRGEIEDMKTELGLRRLAALIRAAEEPKR